MGLILNYTSALCTQANSAPISAASTSGEGTKSPLDLILQSAMADQGIVYTGTTTTEVAVSGVTPTKAPTNSPPPAATPSPGSLVSGASAVSTGSMTAFAICVAMWLTCQ